jgi:CubicO group peptidase (beta-lactamase class C family)
MRKSNFRLLITFLSVIVLVSCKKGDSSTAIVPPAVLDFTAIDKILNDSVPALFNGKCYAIVNVNGQTAYAKGWGGYDGETKLLIASCSKWLSGALIMSLVDDGAIKLSDTVGKYLPRFTAYGKGNITIAQLFSHTSGFPGDSPQGYENNPLLTLAQATDSIAKNIALINPPGTKFYYGGVSMQIAGRLCEVAAGKKWNTLITEKIFTPCAMAHTDFGLSANPLIAGGARSTPNDYIRFLNMIMNKGVAGTGIRVLSETSITAMEQNQMGSATIDYTPYPASFFITPGIYGIGNWRDLTTAGDVLIENSSPGAFGSHPWVNRGKKITGIIFTFIPINGSLITFPTSLKVRSLTRSIVP